MPAINSLSGNIAPNARITFSVSELAVITSVTLGGQSINVIEQQGSLVTCDIPANIELRWGRVVALTASDVSTSAVLDGLTLVAPPGWDYVDFDGTAPDHQTTEGFHELFDDLGFQAVIGDQLQYLASPGLEIDSSWLPYVNPAREVQGRWAVLRHSIGERTVEHFFQIVRENVSPDYFSFQGANYQQLGLLITSNAVDIRGLTQAVPLRIEGGEYSINGGTFSSAETTINAGASLTVRGTTPSTYATEHEVVLHVGEFTESFSIATIPDSFPDPFSFIDQPSVEVNSFIETNEIIVQGISVAAPISVAGGEYSINGAPYTQEPGQVYNNDRVIMRVRSSADILTPMQALLTIENITELFTATTEPANAEPRPFNLIDGVSIPPSTLLESNAITVSGTNIPSPIAINGGEYSINEGPYTDADGVVNPNDVVIVRLRASPEFAEQVLAQLTIGGISESFIITTWLRDELPTFLLGEVIVFPYDPLSDESKLTLYEGNTMEFYLKNLRKGRNELVMNDAIVVVEVKNSLDQVVLGPLTLANINDNGDYSVPVPHDADLASGEIYMATVEAVGPRGSRSRWLSELKVIERLKEHSGRIVVAS